MYSRRELVPYSHPLQLVHGKLILRICMNKCIPLSDWGFWLHVLGNLELKTSCWQPQRWIYAFSDHELQCTNCNGQDVPTFFQSTLFAFLSLGARWAPFDIQLKETLIFLKLAFCHYKESVAHKCHWFIAIRIEIGGLKINWTNRSGYKESTIHDTESGREKNVVHSLGRE